MHTAMRFFRNVSLALIFLEKPLCIDGNAVKDEELMWVNNTVPYYFTKFIDPADRSKILKAMQMIMLQTGRCVKFVERKYQDDYVAFLKGIECSSHVGRQGGRQVSILGAGCLQNYGSVQHELLHILGFYHEMTRADRDKYVTIKWDNVVNETKPQFSKVDGLTYGLPYDYDSVLHYPDNVFAIHPDVPTIIPERKNALLGQTLVLSPLDVARIRLRYGCDKVSISISDNVTKSSSVSTWTNATNASLLALAAAPSAEADSTTTGNYKLTIVFATTLTIAFICAVIIGGMMLYRKCRISKENVRMKSPLPTKINTHSLRRRYLLPARPTNSVLHEELGKYIRLLEIPLANLEISDTVLGKGQHGVVLQGSARGISSYENAQELTAVAIKRVKDTSDYDLQRQLLHEMKIMIKAGHHLNIVNLLGVLAPQDETLLILEYSRYGSLKKFLKSYRYFYYNHTDDMGDILPYDEDDAGNLAATIPGDLADGQILSTRDLVNFSFQINRGMKYLNSRSIIHRDLAARNVLVCDDRVVKVADFGMAKQMPEYVLTNQHVALPVCWMQPEAITKRTFTQKSDVWSFGVVLWEMFTLGKVPYANTDFSQQYLHDFIKALKSGRRLEKPPGCPTALYDIMLRCWHVNPEERPAFSELESELHSLSGEDLNTKEYLRLDGYYRQYNESNQDMLADLQCDMCDEEVVTVTCETVQSRTTDSTPINADT